MQAAATRDAPALEIVDLCKRYGQVAALDGLSLTVEQGALFGMLGPNGAGKSTCVGILATLVQPTGGTARLLGRDVVAEAAAVRHDVGLVFQEPSLDADLTPQETLILTARLHHVEAPRRRARELVDAFGLGEVAARRVRELSGGTRRRLEIARGLLHRPRVLFLDEPTTGLDPAARVAIWEHLRELQREGRTTVFLTTHSMEEADALCEELAILDRGRCVARGVPEALKAELGGDTVRIALERGDDAVARLESVPGVERVVCEADATYHIAVRDGSRRLAALVDAVSPLGIREVDLRRPTLEAVFLHHTGSPFEDPAT